MPCPVPGTESIGVSYNILFLGRFTLHFNKGVRRQHSRHRSRLHVPTGARRGDGQLDGPHPSFPTDCSTSVFTTYVCYMLHTDIWPPSFANTHVNTVGKTAASLLRVDMFQSGQKKKNKSCLKRLFSPPVLTHPVFCPKAWLGSRNKHTFNICPSNTTEKKGVSSIYALMGKMSVCA